VTQPVLVEMELVGAGTAEARRRFPDVERRGSELVVIDERGQLWIGAEAFVMCLWATARYRSWAYRLSQPGMAPVAEAFFRTLSKRRESLSDWLWPAEECDECNDLDLHREAS
jgi:predicted DCC family thiol-disulfide oxidoreductase YuxK